MIHVIGIVMALKDQSVTAETRDKKSVEVVLVGTTTDERSEHLHAQGGETSED